MSRMLPMSSREMWLRSSYVPTGGSPRAIESRLNEKLSLASYYSGDAGAALQAAHDALPAIGGEIVIPAGQWRAATGAVFTKNVLLSGQGKSSQIMCNVNNLTVIESSATLRCHEMQFRWDGSSASQATARAIYLTDNENQLGFMSQFHSVEFTLWDIAIEHTAAAFLTCNACKFWDSKTAHVNLANIDLPDQGDHQFTGCEFATFDPNYTSGDGIKWVSSGGVKLLGCKFNGCRRQIWIDPTTGILTSIFVVSGCSLEGASENAIRAERSSGTGVLTKLIVTGGQVSASVPALDEAIRIGSGINEVTFGGGWQFQGSLTAGKKGIVFAAGSIQGQVDNVGFKDTNTCITEPSAGAGITYGTISYSNCSVFRSGGEGPAPQPGLRVFERDFRLSTTDAAGYTTILRFTPGQAVMLEVVVAGTLQGVGPVYGHFRRKITKSGSTLTVAAEGSDETQGAAFDVDFSTAAQPQLQLRMRRNSGAGGTSLDASVHVRIVGTTLNIGG